MASREVFLRRSEGPFSLEFCKYIERCLNHCFITEFSVYIALDFL